MAGAETTITDNFNTGGVLNWDNLWGGWAYGQRTVSGSTFDFLLDPVLFFGVYGTMPQPSLQDFNLSGFDTANAEFFIQFAIQSVISQPQHRSSGGDPFAACFQLTALTEHKRGRCRAAL